MGTRIWGEGKFRSRRLRLVHGTAVALMPGAFLQFFQMLLQAFELRFQVLNLLLLPALSLIPVHVFFVVSLGEADGTTQSIDAVLEGCNASLGLQNVGFPIVGGAFLLLIGRDTQRIAGLRRGVRGVFMLRNFFVGDDVRGS